jgi:hypothetical protein
VPPQPSVSLVANDISESSDDMEISDHSPQPIPIEESTHSSNSTPIDEPLPSDTSRVIVPPSGTSTLQKDPEIAKPHTKKKNRLEKRKEAHLEAIAYQKTPEYLKDKTKVRPYRFDLHGPLDPNSTLALRGNYRSMVLRMKHENSEPFCRS